MGELKTRRNERSVAEFIDGIADTRRRQDCRTLMNLMRAPAAVFRN